MDRDRLKTSSDVRSVFAGQPMKHCQMRAEKISLRREMRFAEKIEWLEIVLGNAGGED
ncbi:MULTISPECIES: hypothetical protein [unclassified Rhizobium]|uniref:hypothetical protein n=1 Tax=unclassified Rhizobium TaxID=2613769 RepID=UPI001ADAA5BC|nr:MULTISPECIES: hypothetical protein [unclassified Rhizobium]MBO9126559.1 hypothetical protein [Rhizobium sp. 16-488-2b]MBO9176963.1 hypothetical protein [Rhizobium sp. 16-488-2a]